MSGFHNNGNQRGKATRSCWALALGFWAWAASMAAEAISPLVGRNWIEGPHAQPEVVVVSDPQRVFAGRERKTSISWRNGSEHALRMDVRTRLSQTSSATVAPLQENFW